MLILAVAGNLQVTAVHVDHGLRPDGGREATLVKQLADRFGAAFEAHTATVETGPNLEERARTARHGLLGPECMTGHTADDQAETLLINLLRGSGLRGLGAMKPGVRHPILSLRRAETAALCAAHDVIPFEDPSNTSPKHLRNRVRHELLPLMEELSRRDPVPLLDRTAELARAADETLAELGEGLLVGGAIIPTQGLQQAASPIRDAALRTWIHRHIGRMPSQRDLLAVNEVVFHRARATEISGGWRINRSGGQLTIKRAG